MYMRFKHDVRVKATFIYIISEKHNPIVNNPRSQTHRNEII